MRRFYCILLGLNWPDDLASNHFVFLEGDDTEVVGDGVAECAPFVREGIAEEVENSLGELVERCIVPIVGDPFVHDAPQALNRVEMWGICRQKRQLHPPFRAVQPWLEYLGMVIARIVDKDMDGCLGRVVALQLFQHGPCRLGIDLFALHECELESLKVKRALNVETFAP